MTSTLNPARSKHQADLWPTQPSLDSMIHPTDLDLVPRQRSFGKRALRGLARFLILFGIGVGATLAWQSYGDTAREMIASSSPPLGWLAPQADAVAPSAASTAAPAAPAASY